MTDLADLFNSPPGQSSRPPRRTPSPSLSPSPERRRLSSQPLFLSPNGTATPIRSRQAPPPQAQRQRERERENGAIQERREEVGRRMQYSPEPEVDPFESVATGNLGVYDPLAPILGDDDEPARKKRKPIPKIDAERLMGEYGLPALMKDAKRFKVRGKGHEAQDLKSLLSTYQIWAHRMFPRGDFMGTMGRVENVLRTRRMENAMKGYREAFHPPPPSPQLDQDRMRQDHGTSSPNIDLAFNSDPEAGIERRTPTPTPRARHQGQEEEEGGGGLFDEADLDEMAAMEEMEREARSGGGASNGNGSGNGNGHGYGHGREDDGPPPQLEEEDDWEGLYD